MVIRKTLFVFIIIVFGIVSNNLTTFALPPSTGYSNPLPISEVEALNNWSQWVPESCSNSANSFSYVGNVSLNIASNSNNSAWTSNPSNTKYYLERFAIDVLKDLATTTGTNQSDVLTAQHVLALVAWSWSEGGGMSNTDAYNPLNTDQLPNGVTANIQSTGNEAYPSFNVGVQATVQTLISSNQDRIGAALLDPNSTAEQIMSAITYYQNYTGNKAWATADGGGTNPPQNTQQSYYNNLINVLTSVQKNYAQTGTVFIGINGFPLPPVTYLSGVNLQYTSQISNLNLQSNSSTNSSSNNSSLCQGSSSSCNYSSSSNSTNTSGNIESQVVCIALNELTYWKGLSGYPPGGIGAASSPILDTSGNKAFFKYTESRDEAWCADFVSWVYNQAGDPITGSSTNWDLPGVSEIYQIGNTNQNGFKFEPVGSYTPQPGDIAIHYNAAYTNPYYHINLVVTVNGNSITLLGGDQGSNNIDNNIVSEYTITSPSSDNIIGYVVPQ